MTTIVDLGDLGDRGFFIRGDHAVDLAGWDVAGAGDINHDGYDDVFVGAPWARDSEFQAGTSYVLFGKAGRFADIALRRLAPIHGITFVGVKEGDRTGTSVAQAGDVNGDGFDDITIGSYGRNATGPFGGAWVVFGAAPTQDVKRSGTPSPRRFMGGSATTRCWAVAATTC